MSSPIISTKRLNIYHPIIGDMKEFLDKVNTSAKEHFPWVSPPASEEEYSTYIKDSKLKNIQCFLVRQNTDNELIGVFNISNIIGGFFNSAFLGFYRFSGYEKKGYMKEALGAIINYSFYQLGLHRLEANIQPKNSKSENLVKGCGFVLEGFSENYLKINGQWRDHNRFAITKEHLQKFYIEHANLKEAPWEADFILSADKARENIKSILKDEIQDIELLAEGWDNYAYLVNNDILFRMPKRYIAVPLIENENRILALLQGKVNLAIPNPTFCGFGNSSYPYPIQGYQKLLGEPAETLNLSEEERINNIESYAVFVKKIHSIPMKTLLAHDIEPQVFNRTNAAIMTEQFEIRVKKLTENKHVKFNQDRVTQLINMATKALINPEENCLVHGDLYCRHFLFDKSQMSAVIDWGDAGINHYVVDLAALYSFFPKECHESFYGIYGNVEKDIQQYAKFLGAYGAITCLDYAIDSENQKLEKESRFSLRMQGVIEL